MLLVDQVELLRQNLVQLREQQFALPLNGGSSFTKQTYQFKSLVHPARDIATTIAEADPGGNKLPIHLRGWNLDFTDESGKTKNIHLKNLLGMVIHVYYLRIGDGNLDISNDLGERVIIPYNVFLDSAERLVLTPEDVCLIICGFAEEKFKKMNKMNEKQVLVVLKQGLGDLEHCLATIKKWPRLQESIWKTLFASQCMTVRADCRTVNDKPFIIVSQSRQLKETPVIWHVGWRRNNAYAESWIDVSHLIGKIRDYFDKPHLK